MTTFKRVVAGAVTGMLLTAIVWTLWLLVSCCTAMMGGHDVNMLGAQVNAGDPGFHVEIQVLVLLALLGIGAVVGSVVNVFRSRPKT